MTETYLDNLRRGLHAAMVSDERVVAIGEDILDPYGGAFKATRGLSTAFPTRVLTTPISEGAITGLANGMALRGMRPVVEIMFGDFITLCVDQIVNHAAKFVGMYDGQVTVPLVIRTPMGGGRGYGPTHSQSLERLFLGFPELSIVAPSLYHEPGRLLQQAIADERPVLFVEHKLLYPARLAQAEETLADGSAYPTAVVRNHSRDERADVVFVSYGGCSLQVQRVLTALADEEIRATAFFPSLLASPTPAFLDAVVAASKRIVLVEDGYWRFGWTAELAASLVEHAGASGGLRIARAGARGSVIPANKALEREILVSAERLAQAVASLLN